MVSIILGVISICFYGIILLTGDYGIFLQPTGIEGEYTVYGAGLVGILGMAAAIVGLILGVIACVKKKEGQNSATSVYIGLGISFIGFLLHCWDRISQYTILFL